METIKIAFVDFWETCDFDNHIITLALKQSYNVEIVTSENADYVFYSVFGQEHWFIPQDKIKIFYTGENLSPDFNACDYAIGFDWIDFGDRYFRLPNYYATNFFYPKVELMQNKHNISNEKEYLDRKFCSFVVSNDAGNPIRREVFEKLCEYKLVDSGGRWMNNVGGPVADKISFELKHKFSICFENSSHSGYCTEKIIEAFAARTVPIYWGDPDIERVFNPDAFINVNKCQSLNELADMVQQIDNDDDINLKMLKTPALLNDKFEYKFQFDEIAKFLSHIVKQSKDEAKRYNREFWGKKYISRECRLINDGKKTTKDLIFGKIKAKYF